MQKQKLKYLNFFLDRVNNIKAIDRFMEFLKGKEEDIRHCYYAEKLSAISKENFVEMMLLDSVFIIELFLRIIQRKKLEKEDNKNGKNVKKHTYSDDIIVKQSWLNKSIQRDLLLLENQIPWFVLNELYDKVVPATDKNCPTFIELAHDYFDCYHPYKEDSGFDCYHSYKEDSGGNNYKPLHFTDMIRSSYICKGVIHGRRKGSPLTRATELQEAGVNIAKVFNRPLLDIKFQKVPILSWFMGLACMPKLRKIEPRLEIPELIINSTTESVLSNIMALEHCHYPDQAYVCDYVCLFDYLMQTKEDVALLVEKEVIVHELRSDMQVQTLVRDLCRNVDTNITCYEYMIADLNGFYKSMWKWWNRSMLQLRLVYFRNLWRASSTIVGVVVVLFTLLNIYQTIHRY